MEKVNLILRDVRDFIYIDSRYKSPGLLYWSGLFTTFLFPYIGFLFLMLAFIFPDELIIYLIGYKTFSFLIKLGIFVLIFMPLSIIVFQIHKKLLSYPYPILNKLDKKDKKPTSVFFLFFLFGVIFMIFSIIVYFKVRF